MTNIKYLKENGLLEAHKQFLRMCNETYISPIEELDEADDNEQGMPEQGSDPMNDNGMNGGDEQENAPMGDENTMGNENPMGGENPQGMDNQDMGGMGNDSMSDDGMGGMEEPSLDDSEDPFGDGNDEETNDEGDTIYIGDLTNAQEKLNYKTNKIGIGLGKVDNRIERLMAFLEKMETMIDSNNEEIMNLRKEFEKRNPTQIERLDMRRKFDSPGFSETPEEAIEKRIQNRNNYSVTDGGEKTDEKQYTLTQDDIKNANTSQIADSFYNIDDDYIQDINKIFGI